MGEKEGEEDLIKIRRTLNIMLRSLDFFLREPVTPGTVEEPVASLELVRDAESWPHRTQNL